MGVYIIAEAGVNHNGDPQKALKLVDIAARAGADCVKFQFFEADRLVTKTADRAEYQIRNMDADETQYQMLKRLELRLEDFISIREYCRKKKIDFLITPFDEHAADQLDALEVEAYKVSSGDITNKPFLEYLAGKGKRILLSTGMSTMEEVQKAVRWIRDAGNDDLVLFHCTSNYPAPYESVNMRAMESLKQFGVPVGYSDHTEGIEIPVMAVAMGAAYIEKHFTYDRKADGPDHRASLAPEDLGAMVRAIRHIETAFGDGKKQPTDSEMSTRDVARKSLVWTRDMKAGEQILKEDICCKRPGTGLAPEMLQSVLGRRLIADCKGDTLVSPEAFEKR